MNTGKGGAGFGFSVWAGDRRLTGDVGSEWGYCLGRSILGLVWICGLWWLGQHRNTKVRRTCFVEIREVYEQ